MSQKIRFPNNRLTPAALGKPIFATDIQNNTENLLEAINMLLGLGAHDFAILSGFDYTPGAPGTYTSGIIYLAGVIYYFDGSVTPLEEHQYLAPNPTDTESKVHNPDGNSYNTYTIYYALASNSPITDCPEFVGNMNAYRLNLGICLTNNDVGDHSGNLLPVGSTLGTDGSVLKYDQTNVAMIGEAVKTAFNKDFGLVAGTVLEGDKTGGLITTIINIGDWDMDGTGLITVSHSLGVDFIKVRSIDVVITDDSSAGIYKLDNAYDGGTGITTPNGTILSITSTNITLLRKIGGVFDNTSFNATSFNRGWIVIKRIP